MGSLDLDNPQSIESIVVSDSNPYFDYLPANHSFVVKARIDIDRGLNTVQTMTLECKTLNGPTFNVST